MSTSRFLAGALVGLAAGLLLAPQKGEDLRNDLADTADQLKRKFNRITSTAGLELADLRDILESEVSGLSDDIRHRILTILDETEDSAMSIKRSFTSELG